MTDPTSDEDWDSIPEGFGVGERTLGMRDLIQNEEGLRTEEERIDGEAENDQSSITAVTAATSSATDDASTTTTQETVAARTLSPIAVLRFIAPTLALWIAPPVMSLIDTSAVGRFCGPTELAALASHACVSYFQKHVYQTKIYAALSPGCTLIDSSSYLFFFIATAATNLVANAIANNDDSDRIVSEALFLAMCSGIFLGGLVLVAGTPLLGLIAGKASASVVPSALKYATVRAFGQPFVIMASVARAAALAEKDTRGPLVSVAMAFVLNAVGTLTLVTQTPLGITGAAIGTLCADIATTVFLLSRIKTGRKTKTMEDGVATTTQAPTPLLVVPSFASFKRFVMYAAPIFFTILGKSVVYNGIALSVGRLGSVALAAHQVLLRSFFFWCPVGDSVGMTSQVFLPGILAEEKKTGIPKRGAKRLLFTTGVFAGLVASVLAGLLPSKGAGLFTRDVHVAAALKQTAPILGLCISMHAIALTCEGMLLAQRDLSFLSRSYIITTVATIGLLLSPFRPSTLGGSWWILAIFQGSRSIQFALRNMILTGKSRVRETLFLRPQSAE
eukprot:scaffold24711_cov122-Cylindrotheca_fusiformis.AAC.2